MGKGSGVNRMATLVRIAQIETLQGQTTVLHDIDWQQFEAILEDLGDNRASRIAYFDGVLEIRMTRTLFRLGSEHMAGWGAMHFDTRGGRAMRLMIGTKTSLENAPFCSKSSLPSLPLTSSLRCRPRTQRKAGHHPRREDSGNCEHHTRNGHPEIPTADRRNERDIEG